jgi:2'-5' RNA ligase
MLDRLADSEAFTVKLEPPRLVRRQHAARACSPAARPMPPCSACRRRTSGCCSACGLAPEGRKFVPHVALARLRGVSPPRRWRAFIAMAGRFAPLEFKVRRFVLFSSKDSVGGGPYLVEQTYPLAA